MIEAFGGASAFYGHCYITSVCPLGFVTNGINCNYYDDKKLQAAVENKIIDNLQTQFAFGNIDKIAVSMGKGKNYDYLKKLNKRIELFDEIIPLPHPRWVMQYRRKKMEQFINEYVNVLSI